MKSSELRDGNIVLLNGKTYILNPFDIYKLDTTNCEDIEPIELTEETFNSIPYDFSIYLDQDLKGFRIIAKGKDYDFSIKDYPYLHQLQNLYFALTNEELEINF